MKINELIRKDNEIVEGKSQLFITDSDITYKGIPILENSLVWFDGKDEVNVNMIEYYCLRSINLPQNKGKEEDADYIIEHVGKCENEETSLTIGWRGIWHKDHFDKWGSGGFKNFIDRIMNEAELTVNDVTFSSLMYHINSEHDTPYYFINTKPLKIKFGSTEVVLPEYLEIEKKKDSLNLVTLKDFNYKGIHFSAGEAFMADKDGVHR